jgi:hypothetical protein
MQISLFNFILNIKQKKLNSIFHFYILCKFLQNLSKEVVKGVNGLKRRVIDKLPIECRPSDVVHFHLTLPMQDSCKLSLAFLDLYHSVLLGLRVGGPFV